MAKMFVIFIIVNFKQFSHILVSCIPYSLAINNHKHSKSGNFMSQSYVSAYLADRSTAKDIDAVLKRQNNIEEIIFDYSKELSYGKATNTSILYIYEDGFENKDISFDGFVSSKVKLSAIIDIEGRVGGYRVTIDQNGEKVIKYASYLVFGGEINRLLAFDALHYSSLEDVLLRLANRSKKTEITKSLLLDASICDYESGGKKYCTACIDSCQSQALIEDTVNKKIHLSFADCVMCGSCIGACPSGAMESSKLNIAAFIAVAEEARGFSILISTEADLASYSGNIYENSLILPVDNYSFLNELYLSILAFKSGGEVYFVSSKLPESTLDSINNVNAAFETFGYGIVIGYMEDNCKIEKQFEPLVKRFENSALRKAVSGGFLALGGFLNQKTTSETIKFHDVVVDNSCTVCMGCAFVCKSGAFYADETNGALAVNPSLCTGCDRCVEICPEKSIKIEKNVFKSEERFFSFCVAAKDELFYCVECGKPFATQKSIAKVASVFDALFADETKRRTLYCCADCKPKLMLANYVNTKGVSIGQ